MANQVFFQCEVLQIWMFNRNHCSRGRSSSSRSDAATTRFCTYPEHTPMILNLDEGATLDETFEVFLYLPWYPSLPS